HLYHRVSHGRRRVAGDQRAGWRDPRTQAFPGAHALRAGRAGRSVRNLCRARMRRAVVYLRVSTIDQTTANQERELREIVKSTGTTALAALRAVTGVPRSISCAVTLPGANSTWSWP